MTLIRMHEAGLIARPHRGKYITLDHPYMVTRSSLMNKLTTDASVASDTTATSDTTDTMATTATN